MKSLKFYLGVHELNEGVRPPKFYLPVVSPAEKYGYELWPFPLAPFVVIGQIVSGCFWLVWRDLVDVSRSVKKLRGLK